jgi:hypothetical protein
VRAVVKRLLHAALRGDVAACKVVLAYVIGRPAEVADPDAVDLHEWRMYHDHCPRKDEVSGILATVPAHLAVVLARTFLPHVGDDFSRRFAELVEEQSQALWEKADDIPPR